MAFIWRRRSTTIVKLVALMLAIWFCIAFLIYTDDTRRRAAQETSGFGAGNIVGGGDSGGDPIALALKNGPDSGEELAGHGFVVNGNNAIADADRDVPQEADVPPTAKHKSRVKVLPRLKAEESVRHNVVVHPEEKVVNKQEAKEDGE